MLKLFRDLIDDIGNYSLQPDRYLDVPFVPTDEAVVEAMLDMAKVGPKDLIYDLGSGDGRILISAAKDYNARGVGVEIDPVRIADAMEEAGWAGVELLVDFIEEDIFDADFSQATVVTLYLLESVNLQLRPKLLSNLRPGTRVVSHAFDMGDWKADDWRKLGGVNIYKWIVPAQVSGHWEWDCPHTGSYRVELTQRFQQVTGTAWINGIKGCLKSAVLIGERLELQIQSSPPMDTKTFILAFEDQQISVVQPDAFSK